MMTRSYLRLGRNLQAQAFRRGICMLSRPHSKPHSMEFSSKYVTPLAGKFAYPIRTFSSTLVLTRPSGTVDEELVAKLESEIGVETQMGEYAAMPENLKEFLETGQFKLNDKPGMEEVELVRRFGDETIRIIFSIADLNTIDDKFEDSSLYEQEDVPEDTETAPKKGSGRDSTDEDDQEFEEGGEPAYPARLNITIAKSTSGALQVEAVAQDGMIVIENVHYHQSAELATAQTAEADWERRGHYVGPPFGNLDEDLQVLLERYLEERGINTALALFVPDYIDYKEQKEYLSWLNNVKFFVQK